jgi:hypothetical protein
MQCGNLANLRRGMLGILVILMTGLPLLFAQQIQKNGFSGKQTGWLRGEDNVRAEERAHELTDQSAHSLPTSERIMLTVPPGKNEENFIYYYFPTQPAPMSDELSASVWVRASRSGVQLQARLVLPRERNPKQPDEPLTVLLPGDIYKLTGRWQRLEIPRPTRLVRDAQQRLRTQLRRDIDLTDAYVDRLMLNLYTIPGPLEVFIDDLEIGPVKPVPPSAKTPEKGLAPGISTKGQFTRDSKGNFLVKLDRDRLYVGGKPFFFRAVRYGKTPFKTLLEAGFNTIWFDADTDSDVIEEAVNHGFWVVPSLPLIDDGKRELIPLPNQLQGKGRLDRSTIRDPASLAAAIHRFKSADGVLFWDFGGNRVQEQLAQVEQMVATTKAVDPNRPTSADVSDGFRDFSNTLDMVGMHRFPLMTSVELYNHREWLMSKRNLLNKPNQFTWTWIQTHMPDWQTKLLYDKLPDEPCSEPVGPQPEQIRLMTYLSLATGSKGLGFWSDRFLADSHQGRDRLLMMALLNQELHMLEPLLLTLSDPPQWVSTSHPEVQAAVLRCDKAIVVLPIWLGGGAQYVPPQGALTNLTLTVPMPPDGMQPWELSPGRVQSLQPNAKRVLGGLSITLPEFDLTSAVVLTSDLSPNGLVVAWQNRTRLISKLAAQWAIDLATIEFQKVMQVQEQLEVVAPPVTTAAQQIADADRRLELARFHERNGDDSEAYLEAMRSLRPLRILMRAHWEQATRTLDFPTSSPYTVTFYTLPRHWKMAKEVQKTWPGANGLNEGDFEIAAKSGKEFRQPPTEEAQKVMMEELLGRTKDGRMIEKRSPEEIAKARVPALPISDLPGWTTQSVTTDQVLLAASIVPSWMGKQERQPRIAPKRQWFDATSPAKRFEAPDAPLPELGEGILQLQVTPKKRFNAKGEAAAEPRALDRTFLAVNSAPVRLTPGTLVRISGWVRLPRGIGASSDGFLLYDNIGGEALGLRLQNELSWKKFHFYRRVPASGTVYVTAALTGIGVAWVDDLKIEPLLNGERQSVPQAPIIETTGFRK